jgi:actin-related protein
MKEDLRETPLLMVEPPLQNKETRLKLVELIFEKLEGSGLALYKSALLTSYLYSKENSFIVDIGANYTHITPIFEGFVVSKSAVKLDKGGKYITDKLQEILIEKNGGRTKLPYFRNPEIFSNPMLSKHCYSEFYDDVKKAVCKVHESSVKNLCFNKVVDNKVYELPDDQSLVVSREYYDVPELLFRNNEEDDDPLPLPKAVNLAKDKIPLDKRKDILSNIILSGGTSNLHGLADRLQKVLSESQEDSNFFGKIKIWYIVLNSAETSLNGNTQVGWELRLLLA